MVTHSAAVIQTTEAALGDLREAESGQRGFVITHNASYVRAFDMRTASSTRKIAAVVTLTADNSVPECPARAKSLS